MVVVGMVVGGVHMVSQLLGYGHLPIPDFVLFTVCIGLIMVGSVLFAYHSH